MDRPVVPPFIPVAPPPAQAPPILPERFQEPARRRRIINGLRNANGRNRHGIIRNRVGMRVIRPPQQSFSLETAIEFSQEEIDARNKLSAIYTEKKCFLNPNRPPGYKAEKIVVPELSLHREIEEHEKRLCNEIEDACSNPDKFDVDRLNSLLKQLEFWNERLNSEKKYTEHLLEDIDLLIKQQTKEMENVVYLQETLKKMSLYN